MKIVICGSMSSSEKMVWAKDELEKAGHAVLLPKHADKYASGEKAPESSQESAKNKIEGDLIRDYYQKIKNSDAVLVANENKNGIESYIGGNTFLEMGFAHVLNKKIYLLNDIPQVSYTAEIVAMSPVCLEGELERIKG